MNAVNIHTASFSSEITSSARLCPENYFPEIIRQVKYTEFKLPRTYSLLLKNTNLCHDKSPLQFPAGASHTMIQTSTQSVRMETEDNMEYKLPISTRAQLIFTIKYMRLKILSMTTNPICWGSVRLTCWQVMT